MPTLNQIVFNFRNTLSGGKPTRDRGFSDRQIAYIASICRNFLVYADVKNKPNQEPNNQYEQDLGCVDLATIDQADCAKYDWGVDVKKVVIPPILDLPENGGLTFFGLVDKRTRIYVPAIQYGSLDNYLPFKKKNNMVAYMIGETIYIIGAGAENLCAVNVRGIFVDPTLVNTYGATGFTPRCFNWDTDNYPIPAHLEQAMYDMMFQKYVQIMGSAPEDVKNDELKESVA